MVLPKCPQHNCHPDVCFDIHYPDSTRGVPVDYETIRQAIIREKMEEQNAQIRAQRAKMDQSVVDARRQFNEARKRNERRGA